MAAGAGRAAAAAADDGYTLEAGAAEAGMVAWECCYPFTQGGRGDWGTSRAEGEKGGSIVGMKLVEAKRGPKFRSCASSAWPFDARQSQLEGGGQINILSALVPVGGSFVQCSFSRSTVLARVPLHMAPCFFLLVTV